MVCLFCLGLESLFDFLEEESIRKEKETKFGFGRNEEDANLLTGVDNLLNVTGGLGV